MAIDSTQEHLITLPEAADLIPRRKGKKVHIGTLYRWTTTGYRGVILESVQVGRTRCTSREALDRFFHACARRTHVPPNTAARRSPSQRDAAARQAEHVLEMMGVV